MTATAAGRYSVGIDIGGTFTDVVLLSASGEIMRDHVALVKALVPQALHQIATHFGESASQHRFVDVALIREHGAAAVQFDFCGKKARRAEHARPLRDEHAPDAKRARHLGGMFCRISNQSTSQPASR